MLKSKELFERRQARNRLRLRKFAGGKPRLSVFRSSKQIYAQVIDDATGKTLASASSLETALREMVGNGGNCAGAEFIGREIAERALSRGIKSVTYDRGAYRYHGRLAKLAEAARAAGLDF